METRNPPTRYVIVSGVDWPDPSHEVTDIIQGSITAAFSEPSSGRGPNSRWCELWTKHNGIALETVKRHVSENQVNYLDIANSFIYSIWNFPNAVEFNDC